jgi:uncharacterized protein
MGRIVFFLLLALAVYIGWRWLRVQRTRSVASRDGSAVETMVRCETCGLNLPQSDALPAPGEARRWFCCEEHRRQGAGR